MSARSPISQRGAVIPRYVELRDDQLAWSYWWSPPVEQPPVDNIEANLRLEAQRRDLPVKNTEMLDRFVRITNGSDVERFAMKFGVLGICQHGLPSSHIPQPVILTESWEPCPFWAEQPEWLYWEPIDAWLHYVRQMRALLSLAVDIRNGVPGRKKDWEVAYSHLLPSSDWGLAMLSLTGKKLDFDKTALAERVTAWMKFGDVRPGFVWEKGAASFELTGHTFGILGIQLLFAATKTQAYAICDGCGMPYNRKRKPRKDRRNFCPDCGEPVAARLRKQAWLARRPKKGAKHG